MADFAKYTVPELRRECKKRGIPLCSKKRKPEIVALLEQRRRPSWTPPRKLTPKQRRRAAAGLAFLEQEQKEFPPARAPTPCRQGPCKPGYVVSPVSGRCITVKGKAYKQHCAPGAPKPKPPKPKPKPKSPKPKPRPKSPQRGERRPCPPDPKCKGGKVLNWATGRCIAKGGKVYKKLCLEGLAPLPLVPVPSPKKPSPKKPSPKKPSPKKPSPKKPSPKKPSPKKPSPKKPSPKKPSPKKPSPKKPSPKKPSPKKPSPKKPSPKKPSLKKPSPKPRTPSGEEKSFESFCYSKHGWQPCQADEYCSHTQQRCVKKASVGAAAHDVLLTDDGRQIIGSRASLESLKRRLGGAIRAVPAKRPSGRPSPRRSRPKPPGGVRGSKSAVLEKTRQDVSDFFIKCVNGAL